MINRIISDQISEYQKAGFRIIIIIGQRRVGKTVELKKHSQSPNLYFDLEDSDNQELFNNHSVANLTNILGTTPKTLLLDEIQYAENIGRVLKLIHDHFPNIHVIASGSASFLMMQKIGDSALGRKIIINMYPLTIREIIGETKEPYEFGKFNKLISKAKTNSIFNSIMTYGALPAIYKEKNNKYKIDLLNEYLSSLLFKDVFEIEGIKYPAKIRKLAKLLAFQVGSLINPNELATQLSMSRNTVMSYIDLLEKFNIVKIVTSFSNNLRKELSKPFKVYFTDLGILNALIKDFSLVQSRSGVSRGGLFENLVFNTITASNNYYSQQNEIFYWRDQNGYEVDFIIPNLQNKELVAIECKYSDNVYLTRAFTNTYPDRKIHYHCINNDNFWKYI